MSDFESVSFDEDDIYYETSSEVEQPIKAPRRPMYEVIEMKDVNETVEKLTLDLCDVITINKDDAALLLHYTKFDLQKAQDLWYEEGEDNSRSKAGISLCSNATHADTAFTCSICYDVTQPEDAWQLGCKHPFCKTCWRSHLSVKVREGKECLLATCPNYKCRVRIPPSFFKEVLSASQLVDENGQSLKERYNIMFLQSFIEDMPDMKFCPSNEGCQYIVHRTNNLSCGDVECNCGFTFCFNCSNESHRPADCETTIKWCIKNQSSSESTQWILANTKPCPKCKKAIEKNQGCNHMTCPCGCHFCWICLREWSAHGSDTGGYYNCNVFKKSETDKHIEDIRRNVDKYLFYFERYMNHDRAKKFVRRDLAQLESKVQILYDLNRWEIGQLSFLKEALDLILVCRHALKWTYAIGYYMPEDSKEKHLFEFLQKNLESNTERLHSMYETRGARFIRDLSSFANKANLLDGAGGHINSSESNAGSQEASMLKSFAEFRSEMVNFTFVTKQFKDKLLDDIENGLMANVMFNQD